MGTTIIEDKLIKHFKKEFPKTAENANTYEYSGLEELTVTLKGGDKVLYDDICKTCRILPEDPNNMTEQETRDEFRKRLHSMMKYFKVTSKELSERTGISTQVLSHYLTGKSTPNWYTVDRIAKAMDCSTEDFRYVDYRIGYDPKKGGDVK